MCAGGFFFFLPWAQPHILVFVFSRCLGFKKNEYNQCVSNKKNEYNASWYGT